MIPQKYRRTNPARRPRWRRASHRHPRYPVPEVLKRLGIRSLGSPRARWRILEPPILAKDIERFARENPGFVMEAEPPLAWKLPGGLADRGSPANPWDFARDKTPPPGQPRTITFHFPPMVYCPKEDDDVKPTVCEQCLCRVAADNYAVVCRWESHGRPALDQAWHEICRTCPENRPGKPGCHLHDDRLNCTKVYVRVKEILRPKIPPSPKKDTEQTELGGTEGTSPSGWRTETISLLGSRDDEEDRPQISLDDLRAGKFIKPDPKKPANREQS